MFVVEVDRENYEYDVHSLVKAFYPEEQVSVLIPEMREEKKEQLRKLSRMRIRLSEEGAEILLDGKEYRWEWQDAEQGGEGREGGDWQGAPVGEPDGNPPYQDRFPDAGGGEGKSGNPGALQGAA